MTFDDMKGRTYTDRATFWADLEKVIAAAVKAERERCARIADRISDTGMYVGRSVSSSIAAQIRSGE